MVGDETPTRFYPYLPDGVDVITVKLDDDDYKLAYSKDRHNVSSIEVHILDDGEACRVAIGYISKPNENYDILEGAGRYKIGGDPSRIYLKRLDSSKVPTVKIIVWFFTKIESEVEMRSITKEELEAM